MAQNVSSVRVQIQGDARGLNAELIKAAKAVTNFGNQTAKRGFKGLDSQLGQVRRQLTEVAEQYVTGGKIQRNEIEKLIKLEQRLQRQIEARDTALSAARGTLPGLPESAPAAVGTRVAGLRTVNRELVQTRRRSGAASVAISQLGFAAEDAIVVFGHTGLAGSLRAAGNNLSFVAAAINPIAGLVVGVGTAVAALAINFARSKSAAEENAEANNDLADSLRNLRDAQRGFRISRAIVREFDLPELEREAARFGVGDIGSVREQIQQASGELGRSSFRRNLLKTSLFNVIAEEGSRFFSADLISAARGAISRDPTTLVDTLQETEGFEFISDEGLTRIRDLQIQLSEVDATAEKARGTIEILNNTLERIRAEAPASRLGLFGIGDALSNLGGTILDNVDTVARQRRDALAQADPLQAGFQFGSVEAISAINRSTFARPDNVEEDIEKNTEDTASAVRDVISEAKRNTSELVSAIGSAITAGSPI